MKEIIPICDTYYSKALNIIDKWLKEKYPKKNRFKLYINHKEGIGNPILLERENWSDGVELTVHQYP